MLLMAAILVFTSGSIAASDGMETKAASGYETGTDPFLMLEVWMVSDLFWSNNSLRDLEQAGEEALNLESWMTSSQDWEMAVLAVPAEEELPVLEPWMLLSPFGLTDESCAGQADEKEAILEPWMTDIEDWEFAVSGAGAVEPALEMEPWMTWSFNWYYPGFRAAADEKLRLEPWMADEDYWK